jgi:1-acyl-sn-glycerol-3-phosphate acyltransferase
VSGLVGREEVPRERRRFVALAGMHLDLHGLECVDPTERYVVTPLHEGLADVLALLRLPLDLRFAARDELFSWPSVGRYLASARHPRIDTTPSVGSSLRFFREAGRVFEEGDSLLVFAQGSILGLEVAFRSGAMRVARRFGRPLLPVVLTGSHRIWEHPFSPVIRFGQTVSMRVLDPIPPGLLDAAGFRHLERDMKRMAMENAAAPPRRYRPERDGWWDGYGLEIDPDFPDLRARLAAHRMAVAAGASPVGGSGTGASSPS